MQHATGRKRLLTRTDRPTTARRRAQKARRACTMHRWNTPMEHQQSVTIDQLARLYGARNEANKRMSQAMSAKSGVVDAKTEAGRLNRAYVDALKVYKRQQKTSMKARRVSEEAARKEAKTTAEQRDADAA